LTWRSATAFDSVLIILKIIEENHSQSSEALLVQINQYFKEKRKHIKGVTGMIQFDKSGNRLHPSSEIVSIKWDVDQQRWRWEI
jgi:ABC-type branched-subunit amino acid transport system substrate-binding protein